MQEKDIIIEQEWTKADAKKASIDDINYYISQHHEAFPGGVDDVSDGYHTFGELYEQRAYLFSVICRAFQDKAWKAKKHADGEVWDGYFIVGVTTPEGEYTYHYKDEIWDLFPVEERDMAPEYDGHTTKDVTRLFSLLEGGQDGTQD